MPVLVRELGPAPKGGEGPVYFPVEYHSSRRRTTEVGEEPEKPCWMRVGEGDGAHGPGGEGMTLIIIAGGE